jgi:drug/metabolite transporter superfamily protein YnfA
VYNRIEHIGNILEAIKVMHKLFFATIKIFLLAALVALVGCNLPLKTLRTPTPVSKSLTSTVAAARTQTAQAVNKKPTQTEALVPSATLASPTETTQPTVEMSITESLPTATATVTVTQTPEASPTSGAFKCGITALYPGSGTELAKGSSFDFKVTFRNDGAETWKKAAVDFRYLSGPKFQKSTDVVKLPKDVAPGETVNLLVDMAATSAKGTQNINWALEHAGALFCYVGVSVIIK